MPLKNTPSKVPAPPMLATGAPSLGIFRRFNRSAPMSVPSVPATYAIVRGCDGKRMIAATAAAIGGMNAGVAIPTPLTGLATAWVTSATAKMPMKLRKIVESGDLLSR